ncbi:hypothetical protein [Sphingobium sp. UBA5915]|uniref:hypothetical protein n=1 Tax=Sphingobium sp. UBA5915 TaxID=1947530 RepID=UPI0025FC0EDE|nr:hypothetical protein [Sphingobium sp. UBA5915]
MFLLCLFVVMGGAFFALTSAFCSIFYFVEGNWPTWHFRLFASWWWPFRKASAGTMLADTIIGDLYRDWSKQDRDRLYNAKLRATVSDWLDTITAAVDGKSIPLNQWDRYRIAEALRKWRCGRCKTANCARSR